MTGRRARPGVHRELLTAGLVVLLASALVAPIGVPAAAAAEHSLVPVASPTLDTPTTTPLQVRRLPAPLEHAPSPRAPPSLDRGERRRDCFQSGPAPGNAVKALPPGATARFAKGGRGSNSLVDDLTTIIQEESGRAYSSLAQGRGLSGGAWSARYLGARNSKRLPGFIKRMWHGNAVQELANASIRSRMLSDPRLAGLIQTQSFKFNSTGIWGRLRPDYQLRLASGNRAVWDLSTAYGLPKIFKYSDSSVQYLINISHIGLR